MTRQVLEVDDYDVIFHETAIVGGKRRFRFSDIECVLLSSTHLLSFQLGNEVFSVQTDPNDDNHRLVIEALVDRVLKSVPSGTAIGSMPPRAESDKEPVEEKLEFRDEY